MVILECMFTCYGHSRASLRYVNHWCVKWYQVLSVQGSIYMALNHYLHSSAIRTNFVALAAQLRV